MILRSVAVSSTSLSTRPAGRPAVAWDPAGLAGGPAGGTWPGDRCGSTGRIDVPAGAGRPELAGGAGGPSVAPAGAPGTAGPLGGPTCSALARLGCASASRWPLPGAASCDDPVLAVPRVEAAEPGNPGRCAVDSGGCPSGWPVPPACLPPSAAVLPVRPLPGRVPGWLSPVTAPATIRATSSY